jgi:acyl-CoA synthetase (AMP-forming)/AMP-acid ligase II
VALVEKVLDVAARQPAAQAIVWRGGIWSYADLSAGIAAFAAGLRARQLRPGARVAILLRNSPHFAAAYYGVMSAGYVAVPLNVQERSYALANQIEHSGSSVLIVDGAHPEWQRLRDAVAGRALEIIEVSPGERRELNQLIEDVGTGVSPGAYAEPFEISIGHGGLASIVYTSGTTGQPKGVMLSHSNLEENTKAVIASLGLTESDHSLCVLPFHFSYGNSVLNSHLLAGARLTLEDNLAFPHVLLQHLRDSRATGLAGVASTFALLLGRHDLRDFDLGHLRYITQAGGPMPRTLLAKLREQLPAVNVFVMYGQTEATARLTCLPPGDIDRKPGSVGIPLDGVEVEIRDEKGPVEPGIVGDVFVRGPNVMLGYWHDPDGTSEVLIEGWLRTRDLGFLDDDGYLFISGRATDMIKVGAFRVSPHEIEDAISSMDDVVDVAVAGIADDVLGEAVRAFIVPRAGSALTVMAVKAFCRDNLASYKIPREVEFVTSLPRTASGKVQRFKLVGGEQRSNDVR